MSAILSRLQYPRASELISISPWELPPSSELRLDIICFLLSRIDPNWQSYGRIQATESIEKQITYACALFGICSVDDLSLIRGLASEQSQESFFSLLFDLAVSSASEPDPTAVIQTTKRDTTFLTSVIQGYCQRSSKTIVKGTASQHSLSTSLFTTRLQLFPPDIMSQLGKLSSVPSPGDLKVMLETINRKIHLLHEQHKRLSDSSSSFDDAPLSAVSSSPRLSLVRSDISGHSSEHIPEQPIVPPFRTTSSDLSLFPRHQQTGVPFQTLASTLKSAIFEMRLFLITAQNVLRTEILPWIPKSPSSTQPSSSLADSIASQSQMVLERLNKFSEVMDDLKVFDSSIGTIQREMDRLRETRIGPGKKSISLDQQRVEHIETTARTLEYLAQKMGGDPLSSLRK